MYRANGRRSQVFFFVVVDPRAERVHSHCYRDVAAFFEGLKELRNL